MSSWKRTFYAAFAAQVCSITGFSLAMPFMAFYIRHLGVTNPAAVVRWAGNVNAATPLTMCVFAPLWGLLADRYGRRPMVMRSMYGGVLVLLLMALVQNVHQLFICRLVQGALTGTVTALLALVASESPRERAGFALGMMQTAVFVGMSVGPFVGGLAADAVRPLARALGAASPELVAYRVTFAASALFLLAGGLLVQFVVKEGFRPAEAAEGGRRGTFGEVFAAGGLLAAVFALFTLRVANSVSAPSFALFVEEIHGARANINSVVGGVMSAGGLAGAAGALCLGRLVDAYGSKRLLVVCSVFSGLMGIAYVFAASVGHLLAFRIMFGLGAGGIHPAANAIIRHASDDRNMGKAYGVTACMSSLGLAVGPWVGGHVAATQGFRATFILMGLILFLAAASVACFVRRDQARSQPA